MTSKRQFAQAFGETLLLEVLAGDSPRERAAPTVGQGAFQSIAGMDANAVRLETEHDQGAVVLALHAQLPQFELALREREDIFVVERLDRQQLDLRGGALFELFELGLQQLLRLRIEQARRVDHECSGIGDRHFGPGRRRERKQQPARRDQPASAVQDGVAGSFRLARRCKQRWIENE